MVREKADELRATVGGALLDPRSSARVRRRPLASRQRLVGDVARQDMAEQELLLADERRHRARRDELALLEPPQSGIDAVVILHERGDGARPEDAADDRRLLQRPLLARLEQIDPRGENTLHGVRQLDPDELVGRRPALVPPDDPAAVDQVAQDLLEEERIALGSFEDLSAGRGGERIDVEQMAHELASGIGGQRPEQQAGEAPPSASPGRLAIGELRPCRADEEERPADTLGNLLEEREQRRIGPVDVVDDRDERPLVGERREQRPPRTVELDAHRRTAGAARTPDRPSRARA